ncbi:MAG: 4-hydroxythreonine-4-phosphate dehydrogenase [Epsilonproteobacteria bacterium]|nr:4-hydroxythreonine-4-phosphate dehydrogenase [Campylobacterota bacterium]
MQEVAISIGDPNGIGIEIALKAHSIITQLVKPIYCINEHILQQASHLLNIPIPRDFEIYPTKGTLCIQPGKVDKLAGQYSYDSFMDAINIAKTTKALCTLPINKESWAKANIKYKGHTEVLRDVFQQHAIMMLGCEELYVALFTEHIPISQVAQNIKQEKLVKFFLDFYHDSKFDKIGVLGLNPHAGDCGVIGQEEITQIIPAINQANQILKQDIFYGPLVADVAFLSNRVLIAMYHDQGLGPLKTLYFDKSINVSLNLPILRTSVDHGTAFDIAYQNKAKITSYIEAIKFIDKNFKK